MKNSLAALALICAAGSAAANIVNTVHLGNLTDKTFSIGKSFSPGSSFNDIYQFDIAAFSAVAGTAVTIDLDIPFFAGKEFSIENFSIAFRDSSDNLLAFDTQQNPTDFTVALYTTLLAATDYQFVVSGNVTGTLGGSYGGVLQAVAIPIPEPETYALFLAGLGLFGLVAYRRRRIL